MGARCGEGACDVVGRGESAGGDGAGAGLARSVWSRELLLAGAECEWTCLPPELLQEVEAAATVVSSSKLVEDTFNQLRAQAAPVRSGMQDARQVWYTCMHSDVMADNDLDPIAIESVDEVNATCDISKNCFRAKAGEENFSLGQEGKKRFFADRDYATLSVARYMSIPYATQAMLDLPEPSDFGRAWLSLLAVEGTILFSQSDACDCGVVLEATAFGVMLWMGSLKDIEGRYNYFELESEGVPWKQVTIHDLESWKVCEVRPRRPRAPPSLYLQETRNPEETQEPSGTRKASEARKPRSPAEPSSPSGALWMSCARMAPGWLRSGRWGSPWRLCRT